MQNGRWTCQNVANTIQNGRWTCPHVGNPMQNGRWTCQNVANTIQNGRWTCPHVVNPMQNERWTCPNVANTMQNDKFNFQTVANTRQMVPAKKSKKKSQTCSKKILKLFHTHKFPPNLPCVWQKISPKPAIAGGDRNQREPEGGDQTTTVGYMGIQASSLRGYQMCFFPVNLWRKCGFNDISNAK